MTILDHALAQAALGRHVFPLRPGTKEPYKDFHWTVESTTDPDKIREWFKKWPKANYGIDCGKSGLAVIDEDTKNGKVGDRTLLELQLDHDDLPPTVTVQTPSGGRQYYYAGVIPSTVSEKGLGLDVDTRGIGGYVVGPGSVINANPYTVITNGTPVAPVPTWVVDLLANRVRTGKKPQTPLIELDQEHHIAQAVAYLEQAEGAEYGKGGDNYTITVAARLKDLGISEEMAVELMLEHWDDKCSPPWGPGGIALKVKNSYQHCTQKAPGEATAEGAFAEVIDEYDDLFAMPAFVEKERKEKALEDDKPPVSNKKELLKWMNKRHAVVFLENKLRITKEVHDGEQTKTKYITAQDFKVAYQKYLVADGQYQNGNPKFKPLGEWWLDNPNRREPKHGAGFWPPGAKTPGDAYNTWNGYAVKPSVPDPARFSLYKELVEQIICGGNEEYIRYTWDWVAHTIAQPGKGKPTVAIVLLGDEGTGKGMFVRYLQKILGRHAVQVTDQKHLLGSFNAHFDSRVLIYADEAFWAGDKSREGNLKGILSEDHISLERKGIDHQDIRSFHSFIFASNDSWAVPASVRARRFFVLEVKNDRQQDDEWFGRLKHQMEEEGGVEALLAWLMARDLSRANLRRVPKTEALTRQKEQSLPQEAQWCKELLEAKRLPEPVKPVTPPKGASEDGREDAMWTAPIPKTRLYEAFMTRCKARGIKVPWSLGPEALCVAMAKIFGGANKSRPRNDIGEQEKCLTFKSHEECWAAYWRYVRGDK